MAEFSQLFHVGRGKSTTFFEWRNSFFHFFSNFLQKVCKWLKLSAYHFFEFCQRNNF